MLLMGDATEACLEVSLHVSRAAGVEGALPVHASPSWLGSLRQNNKKVGRFNHLVRACRGPPGGMTRFSYWYEAKHEPWESLLLRLSTREFRLGKALTHRRVQQQHP
jgi:hypothetical protein